MAAGEIARALNVPHNTMSSHLSILSNVGLVTSKRRGRSIVYAIDLIGTHALLAYLMEDCCRPTCDPSSGMNLPARRSGLRHHRL